jgi:hypothetical protein
MVYCEEKLKIVDTNVKNRGPRIIVLQGLQYIVELIQTVKISWHTHTVNITQKSL